MLCCTMCSVVYCTDDCFDPVNDSIVSEQYHRSIVQDFHLSQRGGVQVFRSSANASQIGRVYFQGNSRSSSRPETSSFGGRSGC